MHALTAFEHYPKFRYFWFSNLMFFTGAWMQTMVMAWLIYELTDSVFLLGVFTTARLFPMLFGPIGGVLADRFDRPLMLLGIQIMAFGVALVLALLVFTNHVQFWHLLLGGLLTGIGQSPFQPARATMVMEIVGRKDLANATALNTLTLTSSQITGAAVGGVLLATTNAGSAFIFAGFCFFLSALTLLPLRDLDKNVQKSKKSPITDLIEGFSVIFRNREILALLSVTITANIFVWPIFQSFLPVFAKDILKAGPGGLGLLTAAAGAGAIIGSLIIANMGDFNWKGRLFIIGTGLLGLFYALFALSEWLPLSLFLIGIAHIGGSAFGVLQTTLLLLFAPEPLRGRAIGVQMFAVGILPLAALLTGVVANLVGVQITTFVSGILLALNMLIFLIWVPSLNRLR